MRRQEVAERIAQLTGSDAMALTDPGDGWPALAVVHTPDVDVPVALFVAPVTLSHRDRDDVERRFQNPGHDRPIVCPPDRLSLLLGLWEEDTIVQVRRPVLMSADPLVREGRTTRFSVFAGLGSLLLAAETGWDEEESSTGEVIRGLHPTLLPVLVEGVRLGAPPPSERARRAMAELTAAPVESDAELEERRRRATSSLIRATRFAGSVRDEYSGRCAMCGLGIGLTDSAHIFPASAPGATDDVRNGLALCGNHHRAFDRHMVWVDPDTRAIRLHPTLHAAARSSAAHDLFVRMTTGVLAEPLHDEARPRPEAFQNRYHHFGDAYGWAIT